MIFDLAHLKYDSGENMLSLSELDKEPFVQFKIWIDEANEAGILLPNAMSLASGDADDISVRTVLLKSFDARGFVFFTNYGSQKSKQMQKNPKAGLLFPWLAMDRQVKISGSVEKISVLESAKYFALRPKASQLGAWASKQSTKLSSRAVLLSSLESIKAKFAKGSVPLPDFWGGYRVVPRSIEFWQGRKNRLHDRFVYQKKQGKWVISRLAP